MAINGTIRVGQMAGQTSGLPPRWNSSMEPRTKTRGGPGGFTHGHMVVLGSSCFQDAIPVPKARRTVWAASGAIHGSELSIPARHAAWLAGRARASRSAEELGGVAHGVHDH